MVSDRQLARGFRAFWNRIAPGLNADFLSGMCAGTHPLARYLRHWAPPFQASESSRENDLIAEVAFGLFSAAREEACGVRELGSIAFHQAVVQAEARVSILRGTPGSLRNPSTQAAQADALAIAERLEAFLTASHEAIEVQPRVPGFGCISACYADLVLGRELIELKTSRSIFRCADLRQLLVYAALLFAEGQRKVEVLSLVNPRLGVAWRFPAEALVMKVAYCAPEELYRELLGFGFQSGEI
jgi:hypothetical protein